MTEKYICPICGYSGLGSPPYDLITQAPPAPQELLPLLESQSLTSVFSNAQFIYDGDGKRVKSVLTTDVGSTTTYFVGAHYEVENGVVTKYYFAGTQRIAMRKGSTLNYLLTDHLGSTSLVTNSLGGVIYQAKYTAWGEVRYESESQQTKYTYTGQYSYTSDFGLLFYNARWYDPYLNHMTQPDTIVPDPYNSQDYDRYAYARNNPLRYTDPSGHDVCDENGTCREGNKQLTKRIHAEDWKRTNNRPWSRYKIEDDIILSEGTVYHTQGLVPGSELNNIQLSNNAVPPGLSGVTPEINILNTPWWHTAGDIAGAWSDMQLDVEFYPINTKINWQLRESGLWITDIEVTNSVPDIVNWVDINFSAPMQNDTIPVQEYVQANDSLSVDVNFQPYKNIETKMDIRLVADGSFPPNAFISINMSPGGVPPSGCSILP